jgi:hypothetical protein
MGMKLWQATYYEGSYECCCTTTIGIGTSREKADAICLKHHENSKAGELPYNYFNITDLENYEVSEIETDTILAGV